MRPLTVPDAATVILALQDETSMLESLNTQTDMHR